MSSQEGTCSGEAKTKFNGRCASGGREMHKGKQRVSQSSRAGLKFPVGRIARKLKEGRYSKRLSKTAPVYVAAVLEYLTSEVLSVCCDAAREKKKKRISPRHIQLGLRNDEELSTLLGRVWISGGGVMPNIEPFLLRKKKGGS